MSNLHPIMAQALRPWILPKQDDPRKALLLERDDSDEDFRPVGEPVICNDCNGSGEGRYSPVCGRCGGSGEVVEE